VALALTGLCPGHPPHDRGTVIVASGGVPIQQVPQVPQNFIGHHGTAILGNVIQQTGNIAPPNFFNLTIA